MVIKVVIDTLISRAMAAVSEANPSGTDVFRDRTPLADTSAAPPVYLS
ncbi:hypothetical protein GHK78_33775 [Sinorhizobium meliloti]|nr:hypothetical protein [Sinorhizobium meliloti]MQX67874.1 hypothetical protein [Sinorhizobium meliloti]